MSFEDSHSDCEDVEIQVFIVLYHFVQKNGGWGKSNFVNGDCKLFEEKGESNL